MRILEKALGAREAGADDWKKLGSTYAGLAKKHPKDVAIRTAFGDYLWGTNDRKGAFREWLAAEKLDPQNFEVLNDLAGASLAMGNSRDSLNFYLRASKVRPENAHAHFNVGNVAFLFRHAIGRSESEAFTLALSHFAEAHRLAPQNPEFARGYAETFYLIPERDWAAALRVWQEYLAIAPDRNFALLHLARVYVKLGRGAEARDCLAQVQGPDYERLKARLGAQIEAKWPMENHPLNSQKPEIDDPHSLP